MIMLGAKAFDPSIIKCDNNLEVNKNGEENLQ